MCKNVWVKIFGYLNSDYLILLKTVSKNWKRWIYELLKENEYNRKILFRHFAKYSNLIKYLDEHFELKQCVDCSIWRY